MAFEKINEFAADKQKLCVEHDTLSDEPVSYTHLDVYKRQMVDYSCAIKLSAPIAVISARR